MLNSAHQAGWTYVLDWVFVNKRKCETGTKGVITKFLSYSEGWEMVMC